MSNSREEQLIKEFANKLKQYVQITTGTYMYIEKCEQEMLNKLKEER